MEKTMQEVLHENRMMMWEKEKKRIKKQEKKECILFLIIMGFIAILTVISIINTNKGINACISQYNAEYCYNNL